MARRSDHSRAELETLIVEEAHRQLEAVGFAHFSAREVAKRIGYSVGTLYNVFGSLNRLMLAVNARTIGLWVAEIEAALAEAPDGDARGRIAALVRSYFAFAGAHRNIWSAIYEHRSPTGEPLPDWYVAALDALIGVMVREVAAALPASRHDEAPVLARSLLAVVHGHCVFALDGTFALLDATAPLDLAIARVSEALASEQR
jgi:AcrR family transcriptional regulator